MEDTVPACRGGATGVGYASTCGQQPPVPSLTNLPDLNAI